MTDSQNPSQLTNSPGGPPPGDNGFLILRFKAGAIKDRSGDLAETARKANLRAVGEVLGTFKLAGERLITSVSPARLEELEQAPFKGQAPKESLADYWRLDARHTPERMKEIETAFRCLPEVDLVYREQSVTDPVDETDDTYSEAEHFLDAAPAGVDARWVWAQGGDGSGIQFVDLEQGWLRDHEDLPAYDLIFGENREGSGYSGNHGAAVLGIVAGRDNDRGIIGLAPNATTRTTSYWSEQWGHLHIANALMAAVAATPRPHVILLEVQLAERIPGTDETRLVPVETDPAVRQAIQRAVANGIIVVEAGGNGNVDLDEWGEGGKQRLNRKSPHFIDSGAIMVGAGLSAMPHNRWRGSNYGSRIDCFAWADQIVTAGYGDLSLNPPYTDSFNATSGACAIIAGCAVLLQGLALHSNRGLFQPEELRALLSDPSLGTPQGAGVPGPIGAMPDLRRIVEQELLILQGAA